MEKEKINVCTKNQQHFINSPEIKENTHKEKTIINVCSKSLHIPFKSEKNSSYILPPSNDISKVNNAFLSPKKENLTNFKINEKEEFFIELENDEFDEDNDFSNKSVYVASKGFAGKGYYRAVNEVYRRIRDENRESEDFDDESFITDIMKSLNVEQKLIKANISLREHRREEKKKFIKQYGKIIVELLTPQIGVVDANEIGNKYGVSHTTVYKIIKYLENKYKIKVQLPNTQPTIEKNPLLLSHPTYILIETIKRKIDEYLGKIISHQFLARVILKRPEDFIAKKYSLIRSGEQGTISDDVFFGIKSRIIKYYNQKSLKVPDIINKAFENYKTYLVQHRYIPPVSVTPELSQNITYKFLITIKSELENYLDRKITNREYSKTFLGRHPQFIEDKFGKIRRERYLGYLMKDLFADIKDRIFTFFTHEKAPISEILNDAFDNYEDYLILARNIRSNEISQKFHPHLISDYFRKIDTKEKAYWLGFMFADGYVILRLKRNNSKTIGMTLSIKDELTLNSFIKTLGLNISYKNYFENKKFDENGVLKIFKYCRINWNHQEMANDLIDNGVVPNKSKIIRLAKLDNDELYLAFLLGYFDGDGQQGTSTIYSGSKKFLEEIKHKFNIKHEISESYRTEYVKPLTGEIIKKDTYLYRLTLGSDLFNRMLTNYKKSMPRKRVSFTKPRIYKEDYTTKEELMKLV